MRVRYAEISEPLALTTVSGLKITFGPIRGVHIGAAALSNRRVAWPGGLTRKSEMGYNVQRSKISQDPHTLVYIKESRRFGYDADASMT